jgi:hypothetical protein
VRARGFVAATNRNSARKFDVRANSVRFPRRDAREAMASPASLFPLILRARQSTNLPPWRKIKSAGKSAQVSGREDLLKERGQRLP